MKRNSVLDWLIALVVVILISVIVAIFQTNRESKIWNGGICAECGGRYELYQLVGHRYFTTYAYRCTSCGNIVEMTSRMEED